MTSSFWSAEESSGLETWLTQNGPVPRLARRVSVGSTSSRGGFFGRRSEPERGRPGSDSRICVPGRSLLIPQVYAPIRLGTVMPTVRKAVRVYLTRKGRDAGSSLLSDSARRLDDRGCARSPARMAGHQRRASSAWLPKIPMRICSSPAWSTFSEGPTTAGAPLVHRLCAADYIGA